MIKDKICLALDTDDLHVVRKLISETREYVGIYKVGLELFTSLGHKVLNEIEAWDAKVFLDLKYHDIPTTVKKAAIAATNMGVSIFNVHTLGGEEMMKVTADAVAEEALRLGIDKPKVLGVTVLTSTNESELHNKLLIDEEISLGIYVRHLARMAKHAGLDGVVCSGHEVTSIKQATTDNFLCLTPGIRPSWSTADDQKRVMTPNQAFMVGSDIIVLGRPIAQHEDPQLAMLRVYADYLTEVAEFDVKHAADFNKIQLKDCVDRYLRAL